MNAGPERPQLSPQARIGLRLAGIVITGALLLAGFTVALLQPVGELGGVVGSNDTTIELSPLATRSVIYDRNGNELGYLSAEVDREEVALDEVPQIVVDTVLAVEDRNFYNHDGVSLQSIFRALFSNIKAEGVAQGGSTITQQLVKNAILDSERSIERKLKEASLAIQLEKQMSKDEILERYLNTVYFGNGAYGLQSAAETYFQMDVGDLGVAEAALLSALIRNPAGYDPIRYPDTAGIRRGLVASVLREEGIITEDDEILINISPVPTVAHKQATAPEVAHLAGSSYFSEEVKQQLLDMPELGATESERFRAVFKGGLRIKTTFDPDLQELAEEAVDELPDTNGKFVAALASVEPANGAVRALVGGSDFENQKFNYATHGFRQPGSTFKYFVLMAAFEYGGMIPTDTISGRSPCRFPDANQPDGIYKAENSGGSSGKVASIRSQTQSSSNCAFLRLGQVVGLDKVAALATGMGLTTQVVATDDEGVPIRDEAGNTSLVEGAIPGGITSLPIGTKEVHPLAMAGAYAAAANGGVYHDPYMIEEVVNAAGDVLYQHHSEGLQVVSEQTAALVTETLVANVTGGTGKRAALDDQVAAGKTGTTQDSGDVWFVGYTPYLSTAVWIGSPTDRRRVVIAGATQQGGRWPARLWNAFMEPAHEDLDEAEFEDSDSTRRSKTIPYTNKHDTGRAPVRRSTATTTTVPSGDGSETPPEEPTPTPEPDPAPDPSPDPDPGGEPDPGGDPPAE